MQYHPDMNKDPGAEEKFKEIAAAYEVKWFRLYFSSSISFWTIFVSMRKRRRRRRRSNAFLHAHISLLFPFDFVYAYLIIIHSSIYLSLDILGELIPVSGCCQLMSSILWFEWLVTNYFYRFCQTLKKGLFMIALVRKAFVENLMQQVLVHKG